MRNLLFVDKEIQKFNNDVRKLSKSVLFKQYLTITFGALLMSVALVLYFNQLEIVVGGVTGIAVILYNTLGIPMWIVNTLINIPLFIIGYKEFERSVFVKTIYGTACLSFFLAVVPALNFKTGSFAVDVFIGAFLMGLGLGMILSSDASSGGVDMVSTMISKKIRYVTIPQVMLVIDGIIIICAISFFGVVKGIYAIIALIIETRMSDTVIKGFKRSKLIYIISSSYEEIAYYIFNTIGRGVTFIDVVGGYTNEGKKMMMCVASGRELVKIKQFVSLVDSKSLCFVGDISEAFGEGFTKLG